MCNIIFLFCSGQPLVLYVISIKRKQDGRGRADNRTHTIYGHQAKPITGCSIFYFIFHFPPDSIVLNHISLRRALLEAHHHWAKCHDSLAVTV